MRLGEELDGFLESAMALDAVAARRRTGYNSGILLRCGAGEIDLIEDLFGKFAGVKSERSEKEGEEAERRFHALFKAVKMPLLSNIIRSAIAFRLVRDTAHNFRTIFLAAPPLAAL